MVSPKLMPELPRDDAAIIINSDIIVPIIICFLFERGFIFFNHEPHELLLQVFSFVRVGLCANRRFEFVVKFLLFLFIYLRIN